MFDDVKSTTEQLYFITVGGAACDKTDFVCFVTCILVCSVATPQNALRCTIPDKWCIACSLHDLLNLHSITTLTIKHGTTCSSQTPYCSNGIEWDVRYVNSVSAQA